MTLVFACFSFIPIKSRKVTSSCFGFFLSRLPDVVLNGRNGFLSSVVMEPQIRRSETCDRQFPRHFTRGSFRLRSARGDPPVNVYLKIEVRPTVHGFPLAQVA